MSTEIKLRLLTTRQLAELTGLPLWTVRKLVKEGNGPPCVKVAGRIRCCILLADARGKEVLRLIAAHAVFASQIAQVRFSSRWTSRPCGVRGARGREARSTAPVATTTAQVFRRHDFHETFLHPR